MHSVLEPLHVNMILSHCVLCAPSAASVLAAILSKIIKKGSKQSQVVGSGQWLTAVKARKWDFKLFLSSTGNRPKSHNASLILLGPFHQILIMGIYLIIYIQNDPTGQSSDHASN